MKFSERKSHRWWVTKLCDGPSDICNQWLFDSPYLNIKLPFRDFNPFNLCAALCGWAWYYRMAGGERAASFTLERQVISHISPCGMNLFKYSTWIRLRIAPSDAPLLSREDASSKNKMWRKKSTWVFQRLELECQIVHSDHLSHVTPSLLQRSVNSLST